MTLVAVGASAEVGDASVGAFFNYGSWHSLYGFGAKSQYEAVRNLRFAPEVSYNFGNDDISTVNVGFNVEYMIQTGSGTVVYPMVGFTYTNYHFDDGFDEQNDDRYGANVGVGFEYSINDHFKFFTEERIQILKKRNQSLHFARNQVRILIL